MEDIILIDKPKGLTSFDVIRILRKKLGVTKIGHAGTLDPAATGLLVVGVGEGTKKLKDFVKFDKTYLARILFGKKTTTGDLEGEIIKEQDLRELEVRKLKKILKDMEGEIELQVPAYSAVKLAGKPLYKYARSKLPVKLPKRTTHIFYSHLRGVKKVREGRKHFVIAEIEIKVSSGTYIRAVAEEIGKRLKIPATLSNLRRTKIGNFRVEAAKKLEDF